MSMTGTKKREQDITGGINMYKEGELNDLRNSVADAIINALFLVPGNLPSLPEVGANIEQYFYTEITDSSAAKLESDINAACKYLPGGARIMGVVFDMAQTEDGQVVFVLAIRISFGEEEELLGISLLKESGREIIRFNFEYVNQ